MNLTVWYAVYDGVARKLAYPSGGEPPDKDGGRTMVDGGSFRLSIGVALAEIGKVIDLLDGELAARRVPPELIHKAQTVADELVTNVIRHGYRDDRPHTIDIEVVVSGNALTLQFSDDGIPFNPCDRPAADLTRPFGERQGGGMGIHLVRQLAADCRYARVGGRNQLTVVLRQPVA